MESKTLLQLIDLYREHQDPDLALLIAARLAERVVVTQDIFGMDWLYVGLMDFLSDIDDEVA